MTNFSSASFFGFGAKRAVFFHFLFGQMFNSNEIVLSATGADQFVKRGLDR
jgi:hypothetical protein